MITKLKKYHISHFGEITYRVYAPGRINLIGEHTDYNGGFVLPAAIDRGITMYFTFGTPADDFRLYSLNFDSQESFQYNTPALPSGNWAKYLQALLHLLKEEDGIMVPSFRVSLYSDIPTGGGLSSSAALSAGFLTAINHHMNLKWDARKMAHFAQYTEHRIGARVGIMDPYAILAGQPGNFVLIDCYRNEHRLIPAHFDDHVLLLADTGVSHNLADSEYNSRRAACETVLECVNTFRSVHSVSHLTHKDLEVMRLKFPDISLSEVNYVLEENLRVLETVDALQSNDWERVGRMMYESHDGLSEKYKVSCPELDFLVRVASDSEIVIGARMMGGGFGGSTINLLKESDLKAFCDIADNAYKREYGRSPRFLAVHPAAGARIEF